MSAVILGCVFEGRFPDVSNYYSFFFFWNADPEEEDSTVPRSLWEL